MDEEFRVRYIDLPDIIESWLPQHFSWNSARVLDFGCGEAITALALSVRKQCDLVVGVDIMPDVWRCERRAADNLDLRSLPNNLQLRQISPGEVGAQGPFDLIYSWSTIEHVNRKLLPGIIEQLARNLSPTGFLFIQIAPLYYSADGGHLFDKLPEPWAHLSWQTSDLKEHLRASSEIDQEYDELISMYQTLNRITIGQLRQLIEGSGMRIIREHTTKCRAHPPADLLEIFNASALETEQVVFLAQRG